MTQIPESLEPFCNMLIIISTNVEKLREETSSIKKNLNIIKNKLEDISSRIQEKPKNFPDRVLAWLHHTRN